MKKSSPKIFPQILPYKNGHARWIAARNPKRRACHEQKYDRSMQTVMGDFRSEKMISKPVTRQEIEQKMDTLAREFAETHDPEIPEEIYGLARQLRGDEEPVRLLFHEIDSGVAAVAKIRSLGLKRSSTTNLK